MNDKLKPALIGGAIAGLLSVIPLVSALNICCCAWAIIGGAAATYLYVKSSPNPATAADGATLGALAGLVGALIYVVLAVPIGLITGGAMTAMMVRAMRGVNPSMARAIEMQAEMMRHESIGYRLGRLFVSAIISGIILAVFSTLGGLLGVTFFGKRKVGNVPPPPPQF